MYKNILVPVVFSEDNGSILGPLAMAQQLCADDGRITLLHVMDQPPGYAMQYIPADLLDANKKGINAALAVACEGVPKAQHVLLTGSPGRTITNYVADQDIDLIVMASHQPGMGDILWGSTAGFVVRHVQCAVHVIR